MGSISRFKCSWFALVVMCSPFANNILFAADDVLPMTAPGDRHPESAVIEQTCERIYAAIEKQAHYLLSIVHPWAEDETMRLLTDSQSKEHWIRPNTGTLGGLTFLYKFGPYDKNIVGVSRRELLERTILPMMRYLIVTHVTGSRNTSDGQPWGDAWQSAHWAHMLGRGAWWMWDDLPADIREGVRRVVIHEAERFRDAEPPHQIQLDTKAEENAWNSQILSVAVLLAPQDARRPAWEAAHQKWVLSSFLRPADERSDTVVDGQSVSAQFTGANIYDDFTLENHRIVHPDYMSTFTLSLSTKLDFDMTGRRAPEALMFNVAGLYENLKWFALLDGGFVYPAGQDWELFRNPDWFFVHVLMAVYGNDPDAWTLAMACLDTLEKMQARSADGAIFHPEEFFFPSTQTDIICELGKAWLMLQMADDIPNAYRERLGVRRMDSGKIILNRTPHVIHTFSWGKTILAQFVPNRLDRIVSPHLRSGIGHVRLVGATEPLAIQLHDIDVKDAPDRFIVDMSLDHGENQVRATLHYESLPDGTWRWTETLTALDDLETAEIATGLAGILNNPYWVYERGERLVELDGARKTFRALGGESYENPAVKRIVVDNTIVVASESPLRVRYAAAEKPERARSTDCLYLNYLGEPKHWKNGDTISRFDVTMTCKRD